jgi:hypothetical protein
LQFTKSKTFRISALAVLLLGLYALFGFVFAPKLLRNALLKEIPKTLVGVTPKVGEIHINPFLFKVEVEDFSLTGDRGTKLAGFGRFFIQFQLSSIWHRAYTFSRIDITAPFVNAIVAKDGRLNLLQLSPPPAPPKAPAKKDAPLPAVRIGTFSVTAGLLSYEDQSRPSDFAARLEPINFELQNFTTGSDGGKFTFTGSSKLDERIEWHGHVSVQPIESDGEIRISGLKAHTIWEYLKDQLNFQVNSGQIDADASYRFSLKQAVDLKVDVSKVALTDLAVRPKDSDTDWITLPALDLSGASVDLATRQAHADALVLTGMKLVTWLEPNGSLNLLNFVSLPASAMALAVPSAPPKVTIASATPPASAPAAWQFDLHEFELREASISAEDRSTKPAAKLLLAPLSVKVEGVSLDLAKPLSVALDTKINTQGSLGISGKVTLEPIKADLAIKLAAIDLAVLQPYIAQHTSMSLLAGSASGDLQVSYGPQKPALKVGGHVSVAGLHTVDNALHADFINWDRLDVQGLDFEHNPDRLAINQILARKLYARVIIEPDSTINVKRVLAGPGATVVAPAGPSGAHVTATAAPAPAPPAARKTRKLASVKVAPIPAAASPSASMPMEIKKIELRDGEADFADLSVMPNFSTGIKKLEGTVLGLSSRPDSRAKIDIHGSVDEFAPVSISGEVNVLGPTLYTDLSMSFRNIELSTFNPYSGKFAGYSIAKGKLTTELHYKVDGRKLDAQHHIIVDQLEFGAKTDSKEAVSLPIKLAVALLKDRNGVIDLTLPVSGSIDDPKFRLGPIIWKVFVNILEKAVTAPFALLGSLFGGGPNLQFIDFQPGSAVLDPVAIERTQGIVKALDARPQLKIEVPIAALNDLDRPKLIEAKFQAQIQDAQAAQPSRKKSAGAPTSFDQLEPAAQLDILAQLYARQMGGEPKYPESIGALKNKPDVVAAKIDFLTQALHEHVAVTDADLHDLAEKRAANVQQALLASTQVAPDRVFLVVNDKAKNEAGMVRLELSLR